GRVDDPRQFAARATALVHASDEEGFAMVLTEAMSARCPVIAADAVGGGPRFVTGDGRFGMLVPRGDPASLSHSMERMLAPAVREWYAELALMRGETFSPVSCARTLIDYVGALEQPGAGRSTDDRFTGVGWWDGAEVDHHAQLSTLGSE
ncbi:MAG TPA: glycosyltransferase family 4 protein, partial [Chloroflexota bacterium]